MCGCSGNKNAAAAAKAAAAAAASGAVNGSYQSGDVTIVRQAMTRDQLVAMLAQRR